MKLVNSTKNYKQNTLTIVKARKLHKRHKKEEKKRILCILFELFMSLLSGLGCMLFASALLGLKLGNQSPVMVLIFMVLWSLLVELILKKDRIVFVERTVANR